ncbi:MAG: hypothetical protein ACLQIB_19525 [Isosphaeraceae bacterium]
MPCPVPRLAVLADLGRAVRLACTAPCTASASASDDGRVGAAYTSAAGLDKCEFDIARATPAALAGGGVHVGGGPDAAFGACDGTVGPAAAVPQVHGAFGPAASLA